MAQHGLTSEEYERIRKILGREPNFTELGIFSVMWSEHCSYKSSLPWLKEMGDRLGVRIRVIGQVGGNRIRIGDLVDLELNRLEEGYRWSLTRIMEGEV